MIHGVGTPQYQGYGEKILVESYLNADSRFEFYAKFYVRIRLVRYPPCIIF
jgi:hypothetical protein